MGTQTMGVLDELEARAGASDQDREQWLAERRRGVTATELRDIMLASNRDVAIADLVKKKREGDRFTGATAVLGEAVARWAAARRAYLARFPIVQDAIAVDRGDGGE